MMFAAVSAMVYLSACEIIPVNYEGKGEIERYFASEMENTVGSVTSVADDDCLVLCVLADNHISTSSVNIDANNESLANIRYFNSQVRTDGVVHLGDLVAQSLVTDDKKTDDEVFEIMASYMKDLSAVHNDIFIINGNHDGPKANTVNEEQWLSIARPIVSGKAVWKESTPYYYVDFPDKGVRALFLSLPEESYYGYRERALRWLQEDAFMVPDGTDLIIFGHIPVFHANYLKNKSLHNRDSFIALCNAFNEHSSYKDDYVDVDFSAYTESKIVAYVSGHAHTDLVAKPGWTYEGSCVVSGGMEEEHTYCNEMPCPVIIIGRNFFNSNTEQMTGRMGGITYERKHRHASQDLWDVMIYDREKRELNFIRFGAGADRKITIE